MHNHINLETGWHCKTWSLFSQCWCQRQQDAVHKLTIASRRRISNTPCKQTDENGLIKWGPKQDWSACSVHKTECLANIDPWLWQWHQTCTELFAGFLWILFLCVIIFLILYFIFFVFSKFPSITKSTTMVTTRTWNMHKNCLFCFVFFSKFTSMTTSTFWTTITRTSSMHHAEELAGIFNFLKYIFTVFVF